MIGMAITIDNGKLLEKLAKTIHPAAVRNGLNAAANRWRKRFLPKHFEAGAKTVYGYERRSKAYVARKRKEKGHDIDLVWSGQFKQIAMKGKARRQKKGAGNIELILGVPFYTKHNPKTRHPDQIAQEMMKTLPAEVKDLAEEYFKKYEKKLRRELKKGAGAETVKP